MNDSGASQSGDRRFGGDTVAQSETIGVLLLLALTVIGTTAIVAYGNGAVTSTERRADIQRSQHAMTLLDSRTAMVALGSTATQQVDLGPTGSGGTYAVRPDAGRIRVVHANYTGSQNELLYNGTLGAVVYSNGGSEIAYQGGGVWRYRDNASRMVSPPEIHYRKATLTLPIVRVRGHGGAGGSASAVLSSSGKTRPIFPDTKQLDPNYDPTATGAGAPYDAGSNRPYTNPVDNGTVMVYVTSKYYQGWADYFRTRTDGRVQEYPGNHTVVAQLVVLGTQGNFQMPNEGGAITITGQRGQRFLQNFNITIVDDPNDYADFSDLKWSLYAKEGSQLFEIRLHGSGGAACGDPISAQIYYSPDGGDHYHLWYNSSAFSISCQNGTKVVTANLSGTTPLAYSNANTKFNTVTIQGRDQMVSPLDPNDYGMAWESRIFDKNNGESTGIGNLTDHYFAALGPQFELRVKDGPSNGNGNAGAVSERASSGNISYAGSGQYITYLHISENNVSVDFQ
ncbi:MAG: hypothetical protein ABEJ28_09395 [Salinigranum sp.]